MASQSTEDTYYVCAEKDLLHLFERSFLPTKPQGVPTFEDSQGNICLGPAFLRPTKIYDSFYPRTENVDLLYERGWSIGEAAHHLNFRHWPKSSNIWTVWLDRVQDSRANRLHEVGIFHAMNASRFTTPQNNPLIISALCF